MKNMVITPNDLKPGDIILSYKKPKWYNLFQKFFDWILVLKSKKKYGRNVVFSKCNHVRTYMGKDVFDKHKIFEWTYPKAVESPLENWMLHSDYSRIYRFNGKIKEEILEEIEFIFFDTIATWEFIMDLRGMKNWRKYDWLQLFGMALNWTNLLDLGKHRRVCSTGSRWLVEKAFDVSTMPDTPLNMTLPCADANECYYSCISLFVDSPILPEPKMEKTCLE